MSQNTPPPNAQMAANIPKYFIYSALAALGFGLFLSIWVIYLQEVRHLTLAQAALVDSSFYIAVLLGEVPTGIVADRYGRKVSIVIGIIMMTVSVLLWAFVPVLPLIFIAYAVLGLGFTFTSGATDAFFYESIQLAGRGDDYPRLIGRTAAIFPAGLAVGSLIGGVLASVDFTYPYWASFGVLVGAVIVAITFKEPKHIDHPADHVHKSFGTIFRESLALMRTRPALRYPLIYVAVVPMASMMVETIFLQPQALLLGVPIAGIGVIYTVVQIANMAGSTSADKVKVRVGETRFLYATPVILAVCLILMAALQTLPALILIAVMGFLNAMVRPILMNRIMAEVADDVRATVISMGSVIFTIVGVTSQPTMGFVADQFGLPAAYLAIAGALIVVIGALFWLGRGFFPASADSPPATLSSEVAASK